MLPKVSFINLGGYYVVYFSPDDIKTAQDPQKMALNAMPEAANESMIDEFEIGTFIKEDDGEEEMKSATVEKVLELLDGPDKVKAAKQLELLVSKEIQLPREYYFSAIKFKTGEEAIALRWKYTKKMPFGKTDGADNKDGSTYLELVDFIKSYSIQPNKDLEELWNRIVFSILVSNTDDHLRNHNFILTEQGWKLAPLFDVNPNPFGKELSLNITENNNQKRLSLALDSAKYYNLSLEKAKNNAMRIATVVKNNWRNLAKVNGCSNAEIERMKKAFEDESILIQGLIQPLKTSESRP